MAVSPLFAGRGLDASSPLSPLRGERVSFALGPKPVQNESSFLRGKFGRIPKRVDGVLEFGHGSAERGRRRP